MAVDRKELDMGLIDFVKNAGEKIFGKDDPEVKAQVRDVDPAKLEQLKRTKALQLLLQVFARDRPAYRSTATRRPSRAQMRQRTEREKIVLALRQRRRHRRVDDPISRSSSEPPAQFPHRRLRATRSAKSPRRVLRQRRQVPGDLHQADRPMLARPDKEIYRQVQFRRCRRADPESAPAVPRPPA
jgi:hypothetical protein